MIFRSYLRAFQVGFLVLALGFGAGNNLVQGFHGCTACGKQPGSILSSLRSAVENDLPGAATPTMPMVFPPLFHGEFSVRPLFLSLQDGTFKPVQLAEALDFKRQLGFVDEGVLVEWMARMQIARYSLRVHYDSFLRTFRGNEANFEWPETRIGADIDIVNRDTLRLGVNMDASWKRPTFSFSHPLLGDGLLEWPRPVTVGFHGSYNPERFWSVSPSLQVRYRFPIRTGTQVKEFEISAGLKLPETLLSNSAFRGGWRYTSLKYDNGGTEISLGLSGFFGEYVFYY